MTTTTLLGILTLGIVFLCFFMAAFALLVPTQNKLANRLMATYLTILAISVSAFFYYQYIELPLWLEKLRDDIAMLSAPLFFLYILSLLYKDFKLQWKHLIHALPFLLTIVVLTPNFYGASTAGKELFFKNLLDRWEMTFTAVLGHTQVIFYIILNFVVLHRYEQILKENYSDNNAKTHRWLWQMNLLQAGLFSVSLFKNIFKRAVDDYELVTLVRVVLVSLILAFLCWLLFKILLNPNLFRGVDSRLIPLDTGRQTTPPEEASQQQQNIEQLKQYMETNKPYLNPALTVKELAAQLHWPERELSVLINRELDRHFFDFVNDYRIEAAKAELKDPNKAKLTVLEVLYAVGFNSKSSFNVAFKNRTGKTPTAYRKSFK